MGCSPTLGDLSQNPPDNDLTVSAQVWFTAVAGLFCRGVKILWQVVRILPSHFEVMCSPYKEFHVTGKYDGKILDTVRPPQWFALPINYSCFGKPCRVSFCVGPTAIYYIEAQTRGCLKIFSGHHVRNFFKANSVEPPPPCEFRRFQYNYGIIYPYVS